MTSKKSNFWYVMVLTNTGAKFVTDVDYRDKTAHWIETDKPLELSMSTASDLAKGLMCNGYLAFAVKNFFELEEQPYRYAQGCFKWVEKGEDKTCK